MINKKDYKQHRILWDVFNGSIPKNMTIDHINRIRTDNSLSNLRLASPSQQSQNRPVGVKRAEIHSKYKGVIWDKLNGKWQVKIRHPVLKTNDGKAGKYIHLGRFEDEDEAGRVYAKKAEEYNKEFGSFFTNQYGD
jgi:hypothetical protein